jgi:hypothetical protein
MTSRSWAFLLGLVSEDAFVLLGGKATGRAPEAELSITSARQVEDDVSGRMSSAGHLVLEMPV